MAAAARLLEWPVHAGRLTALRVGVARGIHAPTQSPRLTHLARLIGAGVSVRPRDSPALHLHRAVEHRLAKRAAGLHGLQQFAVRVLERFVALNSGTVRH